MTKIKLCGLMHREDILAVNEVRPDFAGFVFYRKSRRYIPEDKAARLRQLLDPEVPAVGVFVNEDPERILHLLKQGIIQMAQLHGQEDEKYILTLKENTDAALIKAVKVRTPDDILLAENSSADGILLDNGAGTGETFDWTLMDRRISRPFFLAGGLDAGNVEDAVRRFHPYAVDVSSGIETDGKKDPEKIKRFVRAVLRADGR